MPFSVQICFSLKFCTECKSKLGIKSLLHYKLPLPLLPLQSLVSNKQVLESNE
jgi:hypothetical protein